jgi:hypothetical protein
MAGLERDPNALATLLRMQPQIPQRSEEDYALESMIPEEQLFQAQEAAGRRGAESDGAYAIPSRESLQQSGVAELRKLFGIQNAKAQAAALPARVTGEYGMANRRLQNQGALDVANVNQQGAAARESGLNTRATAGNVAAGERAAAGRTSAEGIAAANRTGRMDVAREATGRTASTQRSIDARKPQGGLSSILKMFGYGQPDVAAAPASPRVSSALSQFKQDPTTANLSFEQLQATGQLEGASPEEIAELQAAW